MKGQMEGGSTIMWIAIIGIILIVVCLYLVYRATH
jgi:hypothetical protein